VNLLFQTSLGIDIEDGSVSFAYLKASFKGIRLAAYETHPLEEAIPLKERVDRIGALARDFMRKNSVSPGTVFLGMPRHEAIIRYVQLPLAVKENLRETLGYEMEKYVPLPLEGLYFDHQIISEDKESGVLKLLLVVARRETVDMYLDLAVHIGVGISGIEISSTAIANYFAGLEGSIGTEPYAIVFLRDDHLELNCIRGGLLHYSRWIDRAQWGPDPNGFIAQELGKQNGGLGSNDGRLRTVLCGFDEQPEWVNSLMSDDRLDVRHVDLSIRGLSSPVMIPAYGIALKGMKNQQTDINLAPKERRKRPSKAGYYCMVALVGLLVLLLAAWGIGGIISHQLYLRRLNAEITRLGVNVKNIEKARSRCNEIETQIDYLNRLYGKRPPILDVFKELSLRVPKNAWVRQLTVSDGKIQMVGAADNASELIPSLEGSPLFKDVAFLSSITRRGAGNKEFFRIGLTLD